MDTKSSVVEGNEDHSKNKNDLNQLSKADEESISSHKLDAGLSFRKKLPSSEKISLFNAPYSHVPTVTDDTYVGTFPCCSTPSSDENDIPLNNSVTDLLEEVKEKLRKLQLYGLDFMDGLRYYVDRSPGKFMSPCSVLESYSDKLSPYEIMEISQFKEIYHFGENAKKEPNIPGMEMNSQYDNSNHFYKFTEHDHLAYRYEILEILGHGSYGQVIKAYDHKVREYVAIKILKNTPLFTICAEKEIEMLQSLRGKDTKGNENIVKIKNSFIFRNHACIVLELLSLNLYQLLKINKCEGFSFALTQKLASSLLKGLKFLSRYKILHGDIKPENVMMCRGSNKLKLGDFGLSITVSPDKPNTNHIFQSLWYRAPEVLLGNPYGIEADMWGFGCVVAEMIIGLPLLSGEDESDQMALIIELLGLPPSNIIKKSRRRFTFFKDDNTPLYYNLTNTEEANYIAGTSRSGKRRGYPGSNNLALAIGDNDLELLDFIAKCLTWDPYRRMTPQAALQHPFMKKRFPKPPSETQETTPLRLCRIFSLTTITHLYEAAFKPANKQNVNRLKLRPHTDQTAEAQHSPIRSALSGF